MIINRSRRETRPCPAVERQVLRISNGQPVAALLLHGDDGQDVELLCRSVEEADQLVRAAVAMSAELAVAVRANAGGEA